MNSGCSRTPGPQSWAPIPTPFRCHRTHGHGRWITEVVVGLPLTLWGRIGSDPRHPRLRPPASRGAHRARQRLGRAPHVPGGGPLRERCGPPAFWRTRFRRRRPHPPGGARFAPPSSTTMTKFGVHWSALIGAALIAVSIVVASYVVARTPGDVIGDHSPAVQLWAPTVQTSITPFPQAAPRAISAATSSAWASSARAGNSNSWSPSWACKTN